jgi:hypothetical protein
MNRPYLNLCFQTPGKKHISFAQLTSIIDEREPEFVAVASEIIGALPVTAPRVETADRYQRNGHSINGVLAPRITLSIACQIHVEGAVSLDHPNSSDWIDPIAHN